MRDLNINLYIYTSASMVAHEFVVILKKSKVSVFAPGVTCMPGNPRVGGDLHIICVHVFPKSTLMPIAYLWSLVASDLHWPTSTLVTFRTSCYKCAGWPIQVASDQRPATISMLWALGYSSLRWILLNPNIW